MCLGPFLKETSGRGCFFSSDRWWQLNYFHPAFFRAMLQFDVFYFSDGLEKNHQLALNWCCFFLVEDVYP